MAEIRIEALRKEFGRFIAVRGSNLTIEDRSFFVLLGPSGCGKTTTLRMIAGLELPTAGRILLDGEDVTRRRAAERDIAFVFQLYALYPHMSVRDNLAFPLKCQGMGRAERHRRVEETAALLRIDHLLDAGTVGLSGGDRQRVALGRAIVRRPKAFLMDEPLGALDTEFRHLMCGELRALHDRIGATTVYVTHDQLEAMSLADRIAVMNHGVVEQAGPPQEIYDRPATMYVADFIGSPPMNFLTFDGGVENGAHQVQINGSLIEVPEIREARAPGPLALGVRPEHVSLTDPDADHGGLCGQVLGTDYLGTTQIVTLATAHGQIKARVPAAAPVRIDDRVGLAFRTPSVALFDAGSGRALRSALYDRPLCDLEASHG